jgi:hypothetical protein
MHQAVVTPHPRRDDGHASGSTAAKDAMMCMTPSSGVQGCCAADDAGGPYVCEGGAMPKESAVERGTTAAHTALKLPIMLRSLPLTMLG